jgi:uncharacterized protein YigE (DUF2233 family)
VDRRFLLAAALAALALAGCDGGDEPAARPSAAAIASPCRVEQFEGIPLTHCIAEPARHRIGMVLGPADGAPYRSFAALAAAVPRRAQQVAFAMNGGMYGEDGRAIGYYVENGERQHGLNRGKGGGNFHLLPNGVFYGTGSRWAVRATDDFARTVKKRPEFGTQSGPILVIAGKLHPRISEDGESRYVRNAVGVDAAGRAHFVISEAPLSFGKLARYYRDRLKVREALYLDGNVSALWDPAAARMDDTVPLGPLIVVTKAAN